MAKFVQVTSHWCAAPSFDPILSGLLEAMTRVAGRERGTYVNLLCTDLPTKAAIVKWSNFCSN